MEKMILKLVYLISMLFLVITGFGQMPIFKRYYIADIPGLAWLAHFYTTHILHYLSAMVLTGLIFYIVFDTIFNKEKSIKLVPSVSAKLVMILVLIITGVPMMIKNFTGTPFSPNLIIVLDLTHILFCIIFIIYTLHTFLTRQKGIIHHLYK